MYNQVQNKCKYFKKGGGKTDHIQRLHQSLISVAFFPVFPQSVTPNCSPVCLGTWLQINMEKEQGDSLSTAGSRDRREQNTNIAKVNVKITPPISRLQETIVQVVIFNFDITVNSLYY